MVSVGISRLCEEYFHNEAHKLALLSSFLAGDMFFDADEELKCKCQPLIVGAWSERGEIGEGRRVSGCGGTKKGRGQ